MNGADLIGALAADIGVTRSASEDILTALRDLCATELFKSKSFALPGIGRFVPWRRGEETAIKFEAAPELRNKLGLADRYTTGGPLCHRCKKRPRAPRRADCYACKRARERRKKAAS